MSSITNFVRRVVFLPATMPVESTPQNLARHDVYIFEEPEDHNPLKRLFEGGFDAVVSKGLRALKFTSFVDQFKIKTRLALSGALFFEPNLHKMHRLTAVVEALNKNGSHDMAIGFAVTVYQQVQSINNSAISKEFSEVLIQLIDQAVARNDQSLAVDMSLVFMQFQLEQEKYGESADYIMNRLIPLLDQLSIHNSGIYSHSDLLLQALKLYLHTNNVTAAVDVLVQLAETSVPTDAIMWLQKAQTLLAKQKMTDEVWTRLVSIHKQVGGLYQKYQQLKYPDYLLAQVAIFKSLDHPDAYVSVVNIKEELVEAYVQGEYFERAIATLYELSDMAMNKGDYQIAIRQLEKTLHLTERIIFGKGRDLKQQSFLRLAQANSKAGVWHRAEIFYRKLLPDLQAPQARLSVLESLLLIAEKLGHRNTDQLIVLVKDIADNARILGRSLFDVAGVWGAMISLVKKTEHIDDFSLIMKYIKSAGVRPEKPNFGHLCDLYSAIVMRSDSMVSDKVSIDQALNRLVDCINSALDRNVTASEIRSLDALVGVLKQRHPETAAKILIKAASIEMQDNKVDAANLKYKKAFELEISVSGKLMVATEYAKHFAKIGSDVYPDILLCYFLSDKINKQTFGYGRVGAVLSDVLWQQGRYLESFDCFSLIIKNWRDHRLYPLIFNAIKKYLTTDVLEWLSGKNTLALLSEGVRSVLQKPSKTDDEVSNDVSEISDLVRGSLHVIADKVDRNELSVFLTDLRGLAVTIEAPPAKQKLTLLLGDLDDPEGIPLIDELKPEIPIEIADIGGSIFPPALRASPFRM